MKRRALLQLSALGLLLTACGHNKFRTYNGPPVTAVVVHKAQRRLYLLNGEKVLKAYDMRLGGIPTGHKQFEGDLKTPEGQYYIDRVNPNSRYHLSLGISYPNQADREFAKAAGKEPGGDIFIHGQGDEGRGKKGKTDWTAGCIAVKDREMEDIYSMVRVGTPIFIEP